MADDDILARLSDFIDYESPELGTFLYRMWEDEGKAITYKELREAILDGSLSLDYLRDWQQDYSRFINEAYRPCVERAIAQAAADLRTEYGVNFHDPMFPKVDNFIDTRGGQLIREVTTEQYTAINQLVRQAAITNTMTVDQLARAIRPCVGLTRRQAMTTKRFYDSLIEDGYSHKRAHERQLVYAAKVHRRRAALIAQTEMAYAYSAGWHATVQQNVEDGILPPDTRKVWLTAADEKVCGTCGGMEGETVLWNEPFSNGSDYPPAHPNCRCHHKIEFVDLLQQPEAQIHADEPERAQAQIGADETEYQEWDQDDYAVMTDPTRTGIITDQNEGLLSEAENSIIEAEESARPAQGNLPESIDVNEVYSQEFRDKCHSFFDDPEVGDRVTAMAREILAHRNGTQYEDLILFDGDTGERIFSLNYKDAKYGVEYDDRIEASIAQARKEKRQIISLHNHPDSTPPSADDAVSALNHGYAGGIVVGHNGKVFGFNPAETRYTANECKAIHNWIAYQVENGSDLLQTWTDILQTRGITIWEVP